MENKIWRNLNCHLSISTPMYMNFIYKMVFTQEHKRFVTESYFQNGNEEIGTGFAIRSTSLLVRSETTHIFISFIFPVRISFFVDHIVHLRTF
jgi:hypothetical protein